MAECVSSTLISTSVLMYSIVADIRYLSWIDTRVCGSMVTEEYAQVHFPIIITDLYRSTILFKLY